MPYFSRMSVTFLKNGLKWLGYMYIKGFGVELASYQNFKSNMVSGKCAVLRQLLVDLRRIVLPRQPVVKIVRVELSGVLAGHWWVGGWYLRAFKTSVYSRDSRQKALLESPQYTSRPNFAFQIQNLSLVSASASGMRLKVPFLG